MESQRGPHVLAFRIGVDATDVVDRRAAEDHVRADAEGRVERVPARLYEPVEHRLHVAGAAGDEVVEVAVRLRSLYERNGCRLEEWQRLLDEARQRYEVGVEDDEE